MDTRFFRNSFLLFSLVLISAKSYSESEFIYEASDDEIVELAYDMISAIVIDVYPQEDESNCFKTIYKVQPSFSFKNNTVVVSEPIFIGSPLIDIELKKGDSILSLIVEEESLKTTACSYQASLKNIEFRLVSSKVTMFKLNEHEQKAITKSCNGKDILFLKDESKQLGQFTGKCKAIETPMNLLFDSANLAFPRKKNK